jgi:hypothetical protein
MFRPKLQHAILVLGGGLLAAWLVLSPIGKPPGTLMTVQLDPVYHPVGSRTIRDKKTSQSWLVRARGGGSSKNNTRYKPRRIELTSDSPFNACLIDLSDISAQELAAFNTHPDARPAGVHPKPLSAYPKRQESIGKRQVVWNLNEGWWGRCSYRILIDCPQNPRATIEIRVDYGGRGYDVAR